MENKVLKNDTRNPMEACNKGDNGERSKVNERHCKRSGLIRGR